MLKKEIAIFRAVACTLLVLAIAIGAVITVQAARDKRAAALDREYKLATAALTLERARLQVEYTDVEYDSFVGLPQAACTVLVFEELDRQLYDTIYTEHGVGGERFPAVMCLSKDELPGLDGSLTRGEFDIMISDNWSVALYWNGEGELSEYLDYMTETLSGLGIDMPDTVVFEAKTYTLDYDELLSERGILHAVHHGEGGLMLVDTSVRSPVRHPGVMGWNETYQQKLFHNKIKEGKGVAGFLFSFTDSKLSSYLDLSNAELRESFTRMLAYLEENSGDVKITDFGDAWKTRIAYTDGVDALKEDVAAKQSVILARIKEIDAELVRIYNEIYGG